MWPFKKGWTAKQKKFRRMCREEEKEVERMINWMEMNVETVKRAKKAQAALLTMGATPVPTDPDAGSVAPFEGLPDEFSGNADPIGDACCYEPLCPCHEEK